MAKHTTGPWWANDRGEVGTVPTMDIKICSRIQGRDPDEAESNARLIAMAPEMFDMLKFISKEWHEGTYSPEWFLKNTNIDTLLIRLEEQHDG